MGFFDSLFAGKRSTPASSVTFHLGQAAHMYEDGNIGLEATTLDITPDSKRVAIIGLNGAGKTTLLKLLDGALAATSGTVRIEADGTAYDPAALDSEKRHLLAIAAALSFSPAAIVADEPTKGLDEVASARVAKALFSYDKQVVFATHDTDLIVRPEYAIGRVLVVDDHRVVFDGAPREAVDFYTDLVRSKYEAAKGDRA